MGVSIFLFFVITILILRNNIIISSSTSSGNAIFFFFFSFCIFPIFITFCFRFFLLRLLRFLPRLCFIMIFDCCFLFAFDSNIQTEFLIQRDYKKNLACSHLKYLLLPHICLIIAYHWRNDLMNL